MFDKLKQLKQIKELQTALSNEKAEVEKNGVKVVITGRLEVESVQINPALNKEEQEKILKDCFNEAVKKINLQIVQTMSKIPGLNH
ncbi:MAG: YbaB/EbfC family nucleoid-associated protein [Elusimicrobia bacterium]|nr:YbaB/EbfC family nucleoid-associated protein [Elusimicrobiota bacterium]